MHTSSFEVDSFSSHVLQGGRFKVSRNWIQYQFALELKEGGRGSSSESVRTTKQPFHIADLVEGASTKLKFEAAEGIKPRLYESKRGNYVTSMPRRNDSWRAESFREFIIRSIIICE